MIQGIKRLLGLATAQAAAPQSRGRAAMLTPLSEDRAFQTLLSTIEALVKHNERALWPELLKAAVVVVPGAETGSLQLRRGVVFRCVAQLGFSDTLLGVEISQADSARWHGDPEAFARGEPRIARGRVLARLAEHNFQSKHSPAAQILAEAGQLGALRANLFLPIVLDGEVVANFNFDNLQDESAFSGQSLRVAQQFALQATALLASERERRALVRRAREFEILAGVAANLRTAQSTPEIAEQLLLEVKTLLLCEHVAILGVNDSRDQLRVLAAAGRYQTYLPQPRGSGLAWATIEAAETLWGEKIFHVAKLTGNQQDWQAFSDTQACAPMLSADGLPVGAILASRSLREAADARSTIEVHATSRFSERDAAHLSLIADVGASALERVVMTEKLAQEAEERRLLLELSRSLETSNDPQTAMQVALERIRELGGADLAAIGSLKGDQFLLRALAGGGSSQVLAQMGAVPAHHPLFSWMSSRGEALEIEDTSQVPDAQSLAALGVRSVYLRSLPSDTSTSGLALFRFRAPRAWTANEHRLLDAASRTLGAVLERLERLEMLEATNEGALRAIGLALENRDADTAGHTDRVALWAERLAKQLKLSTAEVQAIRWGAYLHDIGKLAVPDRILHKPGRYDEEERRIMERHPQLGHEMALRMPFLPTTTREIILHHHERWDGRGYPHGLAGEGIPLGARVFAVCDVLDALASKRPYKAAMAPREVLAELRAALAGGQFDPRIFAALEALLEHFPILSIGEVVPNDARSEARGLDA
jgi:putative nucleotidyltransferase with HDIG domain